MSRIKSELSKKNPYWIPKHRYYELKHLCLQYHDLLNSYDSLTGLVSSNVENRVGSKESIEWSDRVGTSVTQAEYYSSRIRAIERASKNPDDYISKCILKAVTDDLSYTALRMMYEIPCGRSYYYNRYRRYFWILDKILISPSL